TVCWTPPALSATLTGWRIDLMPTLLIAMRRLSALLWTSAIRGSEGEFIRVLCLFVRCGAAVVVQHNCRFDAMLASTPGQLNYCVDSASLMLARMPALSRPTEARSCA